MFSIGLGAIFFAIWRVVLFFGKSVGLSMLLFYGPFSYFIIYLLEKNNRVENKKAKLLLVPILLLSSTYFIYDNRFFNSLNSIIILVLYIIMILALRGEEFTALKDVICRIFRIAIYCMDYIGEGIKGIVSIFKEKLNIATKSEGKNIITKVLKAVIITAPIVLIIIMLLSSADDIFASIFRFIFEYIGNILIYMNLPEFVVRIICTIISCLYFIGLFYYVGTKFEIKNKVETTKEKINDNFSVKTIFVSLNTIYLIFCYIQIKSLFMGNTTLDYAKYARKGFFQLMIVSIINLITIIIAKKRENKDDGRTNKFIDCMSLVMIAFTFIIGLSACYRMHLYESAYGYTLLRLLVYCVLLTELILFIPTILYVINKKINLLRTYMIIVTVVYISMNFVNFDNIIAKRNVDRYIATGKIDLVYLMKSTNTGAVKQIIRILDNDRDDTITEQTTKYLEAMYHHTNTYSMDFRDYNISKISAKKLIENKLDVE